MIEREHSENDWYLWKSEVKINNTECVVRGI